MLEKYLNLNMVMLFIIGDVLNVVLVAEVPIGDSRAKCLIDGLNAIQLKWSMQDPTTIHSGFIYTSDSLGQQTLVFNKASYNTLRQSHQIGCRESAS